MVVLLVQLQGSAVQIPKNQRPARTSYDVKSFSIRLVKTVHFGEHFLNKTFLSVFAELCSSATLVKGEVLLQYRVHESLVKGYKF